MCGRARCTLSREHIAQLAGVAPEAFRDGDKYHPCENMGPGRYGPVVFRARDPSAPTKAIWEKQQHLQAMRWGLIPSFTKPNAKPDHFIMFNARAENLHERPAYKRLLETKRCIILSEGYYEWQALDKRNKQPYYMQRASGPLKFAGLYDSWTNDDGEIMYTYTILTTEISPELSWMHTRIPVILTDEGVARWLSNAKFDTLRDLLVAYRGDDLKWHAVDKRVGSTKFQSEGCSKEVDIKHSAKIASFFGSPTRTMTATSEQTDALEAPSPTPLMKTDPEPAVQLEQSKTHALKSEHTSPAKPPSSSPARPRRTLRDEAAKSPIKFLFQQQQLVQQSIAASEGLSTSSTSAPTFVPVSSLRMGSKRSSLDGGNHPSQSPKRPKKESHSPSRLKSPKPSKTPQKKGTILAYFQPKS